MKQSEQFKLDICYIVSHGFAARMVMQTGLLARLAKRGLRVGLIAPDRRDDNLSSFCKEHSISLFEYNLTNKFWSENYWVKRKYVLEDIRANPALWEKHLKAINIRSNTSKHPWRHLRPRIYYLLHLYAQKNPRYKARFLEKEKYTLTSETARKFISEEVCPKVLVSTYPVNFQEAILLFAANSDERISTVLHLLSWDNITSKGYFPTLADHFIAWGNVMKEEIKSYYQIKDEKICVTGVPHFDEHIRAKENLDLEHVKKLGLDASKPYLFFAMSSPYFAPREIDIVEWLADEINQGVFGEDMQLIVRPHPQNVQGNMADASWLPRLKKIEKAKVVVNYPELAKSKLLWSMKHQDMQKLSQLLANCTISLNSGSTVSIDAIVVDKPVIITAFDGISTLPYWNSARRLIDFTHLKKLVNLGGVSVVKSFEQLKQEILAYLSNSHRKIDARTRTKQMQVGFSDGKSTNRAVDFLINLSQKREGNN